MGDLSLKDMEIEKLRVQIENIQERRIKTNNSYSTEIQKNYKLTSNYKFMKMNHLLHILISIE